MKHKTYALFLIFVIPLLVLMGCASTDQSPAISEAPSISLRDYPNHQFNPKTYVQGMTKGGHNLLIWQDLSADVGQYQSVKISRFGGRLLPLQQKFPYAPFIKYFNMNFQKALSLPQGDSPRALRIEGEMVECNPGSRAARYLVGFGAGRASCAVACEVYEPKASRPFIRVYARDRISHGAFGGNSASLLNRIMDVLAVRLSTVLESRIGK
jgi:hypothetical protein